MNEADNPRLAEVKRLQNLPPPKWCKAAAILERFVVRTIRVTIAVLVVAGSIWLFNWAYDALIKPFVSLSPLELFGAVLAGLGGLILLVVAFRIAFGPKGPSHIEATWRSQQSTTTQSQRRLMGYDS